MALRIYKHENGRRVVKYLGDRGINRPKVTCDGPGTLKHIGLVGLLKPNLLLQLTR